VHYWHFIWPPPRVVQATLRFCLECSPLKLAWQKRQASTRVFLTVAGDALAPWAVVE
jgi:hypothetical protein